MLPRRYVRFCKIGSMERQKRITFKKKVFQKTIICRGDMLFSRAKKCGFSSQIRDISKGKSMKIDFRDLQFSLISLWKCPGFIEEISYFLLLKITYLLNKYIFFDKLFFESYYFLTLHRSYFSESHVTPRKHANSKK